MSRKRSVLDNNARDRNWHWSLPCAKHSEKCFSKSCHLILPANLNQDAIYFLHFTHDGTEWEVKYLVHITKVMSVRTQMATSHILWALPAGFPTNGLTKMSPVFHPAGFPFCFSDNFLDILLPHPTPNHQILSCKLLYTSGFSCLIKVLTLKSVSLATGSLPSFKPTFPIVR